MHGDSDGTNTSPTRTAQGGDPSTMHRLRRRQRRLLPLPAVPDAERGIADGSCETGEAPGVLLDGAVLGLVVSPA